MAVVTMSQALNMALTEEMARDERVFLIGEDIKEVYGEAKEKGVEVKALRGVVDAFAGGLLVQSLLALWLFQTFGISVPTVAAIFFWTNILAALSMLAAVPIARRIVESHGGHLWARNEPDGGLSMCFALPILTEDSPS